MDGCQSTTAAFPVRGQCPQCKTVHSWIDILTKIQSTRKWLNRKPKGSKKNAKAKKSKVKKGEEHKENGVLSDQDCGKRGKGQKRPRQKLSDKHNNSAQGGGPHKRKCATLQRLLCIFHGQFKEIRQK